LKRKCENATLLQACNRQLAGLNFLEKISISSAACRYRRVAAQKTRGDTAHATRRAMFKSLLLVPNTTQNSSIWQTKEAELVLKYSSKCLKDMKSHKSIYWLWVDQILP
jgi:hypothetical protein